MQFEIGPLDLFLVFAILGFAMLFFAMYRNAYTMTKVFRSTYTAAILFLFIGIAAGMFILPYFSYEDFVRFGIWGPQGNLIALFIVVCFITAIIASTAVMFVHRGGA